VDLAQASGYGCIAPGVAFIDRRVWHPADTSDALEALDTRETHTVGSDETGSAGAFAVGGDQLGDVALSAEFLVG
jgi:hypothetical protein